MKPKEMEEKDNVKDQETSGLNCEDDRTVFVNNIPFKMNWKKMKLFFTKFGKVEFARAVSDYQTKKPKGYGFVEFKNIEGAKRALNATEEELKVDKRILSVYTTDDRHRNSKKGDTSPSKNMVANEVEKTKEDYVPCEINNLSDDDLVLIFTFFNPTERIAIERVCTRWRRCAHSAAKVQRHMIVRKNFKSFGIMKEPVLQKILSRCSPHLVSLDFSQMYHHFGNKALKVIAKCCPFVQKLDISRFDCNNLGMRVLTSKCSNLKWLNIVGCLQVTNRGFGYIFKNLKNLEYLNCMGNHELTGEAFEFAQTRLKHLHVRNCRKLTVNSLESLPSRCPKLETLDVEGCVLLSYQSLRNTIKSFPNLKALNVGYTQSSLNYGHVVHSLISPRLLVSLEISSSGLRDEHLNSVCHSCPFLTKLDISCNRLTDASVSNLSKLKDLQELHACFLYNITDSSLLSVAHQGNLRLLRIQGCVKLTDEFFIAVAEHCPNIQEVDMAGVCLATVESLKAFSRTHNTDDGKEKLLIYILNNSDPRFMEHSETNFTKKRLETVVESPGISIISNYRPWYPRKLNWQGESDEESKIIQYLEIEIENSIASNPVFPTVDITRGGWSTVRIHVWSDDESDYNDEEEFDYVVYNIEDNYENSFLNHHPLAAPEVAVDIVNPADDVIHHANDRVVEENIEIWD